MGRTAKSCGPDIPTLISGATRKRCHLRRQQSPVSGASTKDTVKTIAQGRPVRPGEPVVTNSYAFYFCIRGCGCAWASGLPCALDFSRDDVSARLRRDRAVRTRARVRCLKLESEKFVMLVPR
jgi:hypothetical protein